MFTDHTNSFALGAWKDMREGVKSIPMAYVLAVEDLRDRFRRSFIGLGWIVVSFLLFVIVKGVIFGDIFSGGEFDFDTHLAIGFALWIYMNSIIVGAAALFVRFNGYVLSTPLPLTAYAHISIITALIELALVMLVAVVYALIFGDIKLVGLIYLPIGISIYILSAFGLCLLLAPLGVWKRDILYAIQSVMRIMFFATPVIWVATPGTLRETVAFWNPLTYYLDIVRTPFMGQSFPFSSLKVTMCITLALCLAGAAIFAKTRAKVAIWL